MSNVTRGKKELCTWIKNTKEIISVKGTGYLMNYRCHLNSVHFARLFNEPTIAMVMYDIEDDDPVLHFININKEGVYCDNTLGTYADQYTFYLLKIIKEEEFKDINKIFKDYLEYTKTQVSWWARFRAGKERLC